MTKADLVGEVAKACELSKKDAEAAIDATIDAIEKAVKKDGVFRLPGFGSFTVRKRKARVGRNPRTGEAIKVKASKTVGFKPAASFKAKL